MDIVVRRHAGPLRSRRRPLQSKNIARLIRHGLFHQNMFARRQGRQTDLKVSGRRSEDVNSASTAGSANSSDQSPVGAPAVLFRHAGGAARLGDAHQPIQSRIGAVRHRLGMHMRDQPRPHQGYLLSARRSG